MPSLLEQPTVDQIAELNRQSFTDFGQQRLKDEIRGAAANFSKGLLTAPFTAAPDIAGLLSQGNRASAISNAGPLITGDPIRDAVGLDPQSRVGLIGEIASPDPGKGLKVAGLLADAAKNAPDFGRGLLSMTLFHGTPHKFSKFKNSAIGTGEGAQAFGHGLYFAENPGVAKSYRSNLADDSKFIEWSDNTPAFELYRQDVQKLNPDLPVSQWNPADDIAKIQDGKKPAINVSDETIDAIRQSPRAPTGHLYEVDIPDETVAKMLDWDAPLSEQPESVRKALQPHVDQRVSQGLFTNPERATGRQLYEDIAGSSTDVEASRILNEAGIPGIRFWDGGSRSAGDGTRNIVVFNPDDITQVKRDGTKVYDKAKGLLDPEVVANDLEQAIK